MLSHSECPRLVTAGKCGHLYVTDGLGLQGLLLSPEGGTAGETALLQHQLPFEETEVQTGDLMTR